MTIEQSEPCPRSPAGESHRWRIPNQGNDGPSLCKWCGMEREFTPYLGQSDWATQSERQGHGGKAFSGPGRLSGRPRSTPKEG